ncbi:PREDICTED: random slug protein 5 [Camelina sativa]|uniref:Random slug protein 5 n=1 Tax=Camelina sativa TaxID=90675 RepID=A0ABM0TVP6_CAMSA|nr:PREDICTED: random slug protein 5 [Camelina sativa]XP_010432155.1 PREDICTED: random slug protein 5 [Camelina sativa]XP_010432157.1 PREDICTED: random slug protein 5 [Camelina sativa]
MFKRRNAHQLEDDSHKDNKVSELKTAIGPLSGHSLVFCSDASLRRYLDARNWNVEKAKKMIEETLKWRSTYKPQEIRWNQVAHEGETGKVSRASFHDRQGRVVLIMRPALQNSTSPEGNIRHLVYLLENAILNLPKGQEQMSWLIDFTGWSMAANVPMKTTREIVYILQNHYPERLGIAFLYNPPRLFQAVYRAVKYFLDPRTAQKVKFVYPKDKASDELMTSHFDVENLPKEFGGEATLEYNHEDFSRQMCEDDVKTENYWGLEEKHYPKPNGFSPSDVVPEPATSIASAAS